MDALTAWRNEIAEQLLGAVRRIYDNLPPYAMRVGPGTDAVVFKPWDTSHTECEL